MTKVYKTKDPIQAVIHFAGLKSVKESILKPLKYWDNNVLGTINLLKVMNKYECKVFVLAAQQQSMEDPVFYQFQRMRQLIH